MAKISRNSRPLELAVLILKHNANASPEMLADIISEWGDLFDDQEFPVHNPLKSQDAAPHQYSRLTPFEPR